MNPLLSFFLAGPAAPARLQALLIGVMGMALVCAGLLIYGGYWHLQATKKDVELVAARAQVAVLAKATETCNAGVEVARKASDAALTHGRQLLDLARKGQAQGAQVASSIEQLAAQRPAAGEGCTDAWREIEAAERKARGAP